MVVVVCFSFSVSVSHCILCSPPPLPLPPPSLPQTDVLLQLDLHYTQLGTKQRARESLQKILRKSLVAQLFSQKKCVIPPRQEASKPSSSYPKDGSMVPAAQKGLASLEVESGSSSQCSSKSNTCSEPEENDESDLSSLCSALLRATPGQNCS